MSEAMIDKGAFRNLSYGLYLVSTVKDGRPVGCVVNTFAQVTSAPPQVSIAINKDNFTTQGIEESGAFEVVVLHKDAPMELIGAFGFHSSKDTDKFANYSTITSSQGLPYVAEAGCAHFSVKVNQQLDLGSHIFFVGDVVEADTIGQTDPMTYAYYHEVKGGRTPKNASSFNEDAPVQVSASGEGASEGASGEKPLRIAWKCQLCGHIEYVDVLPDGFVCPVCAAPPELFEKIEVEV